MTGTARPPGGPSLGPAHHTARPALHHGSLPQASGGRGGGGGCGGGGGLAGAGAEVVKVEVGVLRPVLHPASCVIRPLSCVLCPRPLSVLCVQVTGSLSCNCERRACRRQG